MAEEKNQSAVASESVGGLRGHVVTWLFSVLSALIVGAAWIYAHPAPAFAVVDVNALVNEEARMLMSAVKPDATKEHQEEAIKRASEFGNRLDKAIARFAADCGCVVINAAAIVAQPRKMPIPDATDRVRSMLKEP